MSARDELHTLVDRVPEKKLEHAHQMLDFIINPPPPRPEIEKLKRRGQEYRRIVEQRFRETQKPGTVGRFGGGGSLGFDKQGRGSGHHSFSYWDGNAVVYQSMRYYAGQELETMERLSTAADGTKLLYEIELSSGGRTIRREGEFPCAATNNSPERSD